MHKIVAAAALSTILSSPAYSLTYSMGVGGFFDLGLGFVDMIPANRQTPAVSITATGNGSASGNASVTYTPPDANFVRTTIDWNASVSGSAIGFSEFAFSFAPIPLGILTPSELQIRWGLAGNLALNSLPGNASQVFPTGTWAAVALGLRVVDTVTGEVARYDTGQEAVPGVPILKSAAVDIGLATFCGGKIRGPFAHSGAYTLPWPQEIPFLGGSIESFGLEVYARGAASAAGCDEDPIVIYPSDIDIDFDDPINVIPVPAALPLLLSGLGLLAALRRRSRSGVA